MFKLCWIAPLLVILSCHSSKQMSEDKAKNDTCQTQGMVTDFSGLDGCQKLIVTRDGKKYQVVEGWPDDVDMMAGQPVKFNFEIIKDAMSICMSEDANIKITCLELVGGAIGGIKPDIPDKPEKLECVNTKDPLSVAWIKNAMAKHEPREIKKYNYEDGWAYHMTGGPVSYLYDCQGNLMCDIPGKILNDCVRLIHTLGEGTTIWVMND